MADFLIFCGEKRVLAILECQVPFWRTWRHFRSVNGPKNEIRTKQKLYASLPILNKYICIKFAINEELFLEIHQKKITKQVLLTLIISRDTLTSLVRPKFFFKVLKTHIAAQVSSIRTEWCWDEANLAIFCGKKCVY